MEPSSPFRYGVAGTPPQRKSGAYYISRLSLIFPFLLILLGISSTLSARPPAGSEAEQIRRQTNLPLGVSLVAAGTVCGLLGIVGGIRDRDGMTAGLAGIGLVINCGLIGIWTFVLFDFLMSWSLSGTTAPPSPATRQPGFDGRIEEPWGYGPRRQPSGIAGGEQARSGMSRANEGVNVRPMMHDMTTRMRSRQELQGLWFRISPGQSRADKNAERYTFMLSTIVHAGPGHGVEHIQ